MDKIVKRVGAQEGYDLWADTYDVSPNPVVHLDERYTISHLKPLPGEQILDAGCGTGRNLVQMVKAGSQPIGMDFSNGMMQVAHQQVPDVPFLRADLHAPLPFKAECFDAVLCALVGEHLKHLTPFFHEVYKVLKSGCRFVFSVYHPALAQAGSEANFVHSSGVEYRLGAVQYTTEDYLQSMEEVGFKELKWAEYKGDEAMVNALPTTVKYLNKPLLLIIEAKK